MIPPLRRWHAPALRPPTASGDSRDHPVASSGTSGVVRRLLHIVGLIFPVERLEVAGMVFREVSVIEIREVLRAWLAGKSERAVAAH